MTAQLLIGPLLRRVVGDRATIWVETTGPAVVRVRADGGAAGRADTFTAFGHHYAMVVVENLAPDTDSAYEVLLAYALAPLLAPEFWPPAGAAA